METLIVPEEVELKARKAYDTYTDFVGGLAFNGDVLPHSKDFFIDPTKIKQANAWRQAILAIL